MQALNPLNPRFEPGRPVYVLLHEDKSHIYSRPDGEPAWSYEKNSLELIRKILKHDFACTSYHVLPLSQAWPLLCNTQAELEKIWSRTIDQIRRAKRPHDRIVIYRTFMQRTNRPHPIAADAELKKLLGLK